MKTHPELDNDKKSLTLRVPGDLTSTTAEAVRNDVQHLFQTGEDWTVFNLDLTSAKMVDSVGLNLVVSVFRRVKARGGTMQVTYSSPNILRTFIFTRLDQHVELIKVP